MVTPTFRVSVIVCAYTERRWDDLLCAVDALKGQTIAPHEIIVVIDHNPALYDRAADHLDGIKLLKNVNKQGLSGARNTGIDQAEGDILAFVDEDALARSDWLENLLPHFADEGTIGVGGQIVPMWLSGRPRWFPNEFDWVVGCTYRGMPKDANPVRNLIGCNMSFRREIFDEVGQFREDVGRIGTLPVGCEETELCIRAHQHCPEHHLIYEPTALVDHRVPADRGTWRYFLKRCYSEGISKALISRYVGTSDSLSSERGYVAYTLPSGVLLDLSDTLKGDVTGIVRATAIVLGLAATGIGFLVGTVS